MKNRVSLIILYDTKFRYLLQQRTDDAKRLPGYWAFFGGGILPGESPTEAVKREAKEEINFLCQNQELIHEREYTLPTGEQGHMYVFIERVIQDSISRLSLHEGQNWGWFDIKEASVLKMIAHDGQILQYVDDLLKKRKKQGG